jgi:hypothetical protein
VILVALIAEGQRASDGFVESVAAGLAVPEQSARFGLRGAAAVGVGPVLPAGKGVAVLVTNQKAELVALGMTVLDRVAGPGLRDAVVVDTRLVVPVGERVAVPLRAFLRAATLPRRVCPTWPVGALPSVARSGGLPHAMLEWSEHE